MPRCITGKMIKEVESRRLLKVYQSVQRRVRTVWPASMWDPAVFPRFGAELLAATGQVKMHAKITLSLEVHYCPHLAKVSSSGSSHNGQRC